LHAALEAEFALCVLTGSPNPRALAKTMQRIWGYPERTLAKAEGKFPGNHGDPEIGRQEKAFYDALTAGQKRAFASVTELVNQLFDKHESWEGIDPWQMDEPIEEWRRHAFFELATHPMRAYALGQMLASEALAKPLHRPLLPTDGRAIRFLEHTTFNEIDDSFNDLKADLRRMLIDGMQNGENPKVISRRIENELKDRETAWGRIAITETSRAESVGRLREFEDAGLELTIGSSAHDDKCCDRCLELIDGKVYRVADLIGRSNYGIKQTAWVATIPLHPQCRCAWLPYKVGDPLDVSSRYDVPR
jgi:SPP1 gp7 family putative phage head morphogenesis protein